MKNMLRKGLHRTCFSGVGGCFEGVQQLLRSHQSSLFIICLQWSRNFIVSIDSLNLNISYTTIIAFTGHVKYANHAR